MCEPDMLETTPRMKITTIVFDFGNVLGFFSHRRATEALARHTHLRPDEIAAAYVGTDLEDEYEAGRLTTAEFRRRVCELCHLRCADDLFDRAVQDIFWENEAVCALIPRLKPRYRLLLLSNTNELHANYFRKLFAPTLAHFDALVLSHEVGIRKPDERVYRHVEKLAGAAPHECLFIDDLVPNIAAARQCGWSGIVYRHEDDLVASLAEHGVTL